MKDNAVTTLECDKSVSSRYYDTTSTCTMSMGTPAADRGAGCLSGNGLSLYLPLQVQLHNRFSSEFQPIFFPGIFVWPEDI